MFILFELLKNPAKETYPTNITGQMCNLVSLEKLK